jgi:RES domain-containing protein
MRVAWRLCSVRFAATALDGEGARIHGGRWNEKGTPMVYCSSTLALAMLETLVHTSSVPPNHVAIRIEIPPSVRVETWPLSTLPAGWQGLPAPIQLAQLGTAWARGSSSVALEVPSAIVALETNILLNPLHPDMSRLLVDPPIPQPFDARLK